MVRLARAALVGLWLGVAACGGGSSGSGASGEATAVPAPVPAPQDLALECVLPAPDATWAKARSEIGGVAAFLPTTAGGLVAVALHFPLALSEAIDGRVPAVCAATLAKDADAPRGVLGVHLRWPDRLIDGLTKGAEARFTVRTDAATQMQILEPRDPKDAAGATAVLGNYLLIAGHAEDLAAIGPYVARTLPVRTRDFPAAGVRIAGVKEEASADLVARVPAAALGGPIAAASARMWSSLAARLAEKLPVPFPFTEDAGAALAVMPDLEGAELRLTIGDRSTRVEATAPVKKGSAGDAATRAIAAGDASPLLVLPRDTLAAAFFRRIPGASPSGAADPKASTSAASSAAPASTTGGANAGPNGASAGANGSASPTASANASAGASASPGASGAPSGSAAPASGANATASSVAKALGVSDEKDAAKIEQLARAFDGARGGWTTAGFRFDGTGPSAFVRAAVRDDAALDGALKDFIALADGARPTDPVRGTKLRASGGKTVLENIPGDVYRVRLARGGDASKKAAEPPAAPTDTPNAVDLLFRRSDDVFVAAAGYASRDALRAVLTAPTSGDNLQKVPEIAEPIARLGDGVAIAAFVDPASIAASRAGKPGSTPVAPIVIGLGREAGDTVTVFARIDAPNTAIAELGRWLSQ